MLALQFQVAGREVTEPTLGKILQEKNQFKQQNLLKTNKQEKQLKCYTECFFMFGKEKQMKNYAFCKPSEAQNMCFQIIIIIVFK